MIVKILDMDKADAFICLKDGTTMDIEKNELPRNARVGDTVNIEVGKNNFINNSTNIL